MAADREQKPVVCVLSNIKPGQTVNIKSIDYTTAGTGTNACSVEVRGADDVSV